MQKKILSILNDIRPDVDFLKSKDFFEDELLDSFDVITFVEAVEIQFGIEFNGEDIIPENFMNLEVIEKIIKKYM